MNEDWKPDPRVIEVLEKEAKKHAGKAIMISSDKEMTVENILQEVKNGTEDGKRLHGYLLEYLSKKDQK
ncbi:MAG: hypothetical protein AAB556_02120 [Patescibacteria group bacterium]